MTHNTFGRTWQGNWIWVEDPSVTQGNPISPDRRERAPAMALFRKSFDLTDAPTTMPARLTADSRYVLRINGRLLGRGPVRAQPRRLSYDTYDLAPALQQGTNTISVEVLYYGRANSLWMPAVGNATLGRSGVLVFEATDPASGLWITSDETWRGQLCAAFRDDAHDPDASMVGGGVPAQSHDARFRPAHWTVPEFSDLDWPLVHKITPIHMGGPGRSTPPSDPYGPMTGHQLPKSCGDILRPVTIRTEYAAGAIDQTVAPPAARVEASCLHAKAQLSTDTPLPVTAKPDAGTHTRIHLDFGRIVVGHVGFDIAAPAGTMIELAYLEDPVTKPAHFGAHGGTRYVARGGQDIFETIDRQGLRHAVLLSDGPITLNDFTVTEALSPWSGNTGFAADDPLLERLYEAGKRTVAVNSWDCFIDCPTREQRAWAGDSVVHLMTHLAANGDWELCWRHLTLAASPRSDGILPMSAAGDVEFGEGFTIPDWSLHWLHGLYLMHLHTGDLDRVRALMPVAEGILRWFLPSLGPDGLLEDVPEWCLVDWSAIHTRAKSAAVNGLWARGLSEFAQMSRWLGDTGRANWAEALHANVKQGFETFWDADRNLYVDQIVQGTRNPACNQISTALAIVAGLCPQESIAPAATAMMTNLTEKSWLFGPVDPSDPGARFRSMITSQFQPDWDVATQVVSAQPFMSYVVHDALAIAGQGEALLQSRL